MFFSVFKTPYCVVVAVVYSVTSDLASLTLNNQFFRDTSLLVISIEAHLVLLFSVPQVGMLGIMS